MREYKNSTKDKIDIIPKGYTEFSGNLLARRGDKCWNLNKGWVGVSKDDIGETRAKNFYKIVRKTKQ